MANKIVTIRNHGFHIKPQRALQIICFFPIDKLHLYLPCPYFYLDRSILCRVNQYQDSNWICIHRNGSNGKIKCAKDLSMYWSSDRRRTNENYGEGGQKEVSWSQGSSMPEKKCKVWPIVLGSLAVCLWGSHNRCCQLKVDSKVDREVIKLWNQSSEGWCRTWTYQEVGCWKPEKCYMVLLRRH